MAAEILEFPRVSAAVTPVAHFIRVGSAHLKVEELLAAGRFPARRVVVEASRLHHQKPLIDELRQRGVEIVLDPQIAELAARSKFEGQARHAPWGALADSRPLGPEHFRANARSDVIGAIARTAVQAKVDVVLAPTHFLADPEFPDWLTVDCQACIALRNALDREGGGAIAIDYPVLHSHVELARTEVRSTLLEQLADLPFDNLWVRSSGLEPVAGPHALRKFLTAMSAMHNLGRPIIADHLHGLTSTAAIAFGAVSGKGHGIGEQERFDARDWHKQLVRDDDTRFGRTVRIAIPGLGRTLTKAETELLARSRGGRKLVACTDRDCCAHGLSDMLDQSRRHAAYQAFREIDQLSQVPDHSRAAHFLTKSLNQTARLAREVKDLKPSETEAVYRRVDLDSLKRRLADHARKMDKIEEVLEKHYQNQLDGAPRALPVSRIRNLSSNHTVKSK